MDSKTEEWRAHIIRTSNWKWALDSNKLWAGIFHLSEQIGNELQTDFIRIILSVAFRFSGFQGWVPQIILYNRHSSFWCCLVILFPPFILAYKKTRWCWCLVFAEVNKLLAILLLCRQLIFTLYIQESDHNTLLLTAWVKDEEWCNATDCAGRTEVGQPFWPNTTSTGWWMCPTCLTSLGCLYPLYMG